MSSERMGKICGLAICGLLTDGVHHKQWFLEQILGATGAKLEDAITKLAAEGYDFEPGIAP